MNINRIFAMVIRYFINLRHNFDRLSDMFYWPAMDLFLWGLTGLYLTKVNTQFPHTIAVMLTGLIFWVIVWRAQYEITTNLLSEMWDQNLVNIFASPLKVSEWITSVILFGFGKMIISFFFSALLAFLFFQYSVFLFGVLLIPIAVNLLLTGWVAGFFVAAFIIRYGMRIQTTAWMGVVLIAPFSALYYPVSILPGWAQQVAIAVPLSHIFEGMRAFIFTGTFPTEKFLISFVLNVFYLIVAIWFFRFMFNKSRGLGLGRLA